jgi:AcrR family transcriptional regulator
MSGSVTRNTRSRVPRVPRASSSAHPDGTRDTAILDAALQELAEQGYDAMSMDDIASRARVGKAAIYRRWPSKPAVVSAAIAHWRRRLGPLKVPDTGSLHGDLKALVAAVPDLNDRDLGTINVIVGVATAATHDPDLAAALNEFALSQPRELISAVLNQAAKRGEIPADQDLSLIPDAVLGLSMLQLVLGRPIGRAFYRRILEGLILPLATHPKTS